MARISKEDYEKLGEHLTGIDATLAAFGAARGYTVYPPLSGGRYPNRRLTQEGPVFRTIVFEMQNAPNGERFRRFFPEIPYSIFAAAWIDDHQKHIRSHGTSLRIGPIPFAALARTLQLHLDHFHDYLSRVDADYILECGPTSELAVVSTGLDV